MNKDYLAALNTYIADLAVINVKVHNIHWNILGHPFIMIHKYTESLYDLFFAQYDQIAERIRAQKEFPVGNLKTYLELTTIEELQEPSKNIPIWHGMVLIHEDITTLNKAAKSLKEMAEENKDYATSSILDGHITKFEEALWFIRSMDLKHLDAE
jgi:starvation-inducible DNA-binding protein